jgi:hypothetical protein
MGHSADTASHQAVEKIMLDSLHYLYCKSMTRRPTIKTPLTYYGGKQQLRQEDH